MNIKKQKCIIIGDPVGHSMSPAMHNAGYKALGIEDQFEFSTKEVKAGDLESAIEEIKSQNIRGVSVTMPHKEGIMKYLDEVDEVAEKIGAVNTVVNENGLLKGHNTDWIGIVKPLESLADLDNKKVAVLGAGGAARAIVYGLLAKGAEVKVFNRTLDKTQELADEFECEASSMDGLGEIQEYDIIINSTSVGMEPDVNESLVPRGLLNDKQIVFDIIYHPQETKLLKDAKEQGARAISGLEMLLYQGVAQFELYTGQKAPVEAMREALK
jgi:shikimate dehydrogenase